MQEKREYNDGRVHNENNIIILCESPEVLTLSGICVCLRTDTLTGFLDFGGFEAKTEESLKSLCLLGGLTGAASEEYK